jgi:hypothetical protein
MEKNFRNGVRYVVEPRLVPMTKAARRLHLTLAEFKAHLPALRRDGFPTACAITGHFDLKAIDAWLDKRAGVVEPNEISDDEAERIFQEALANIGEPTKPRTKSDS